MNSVSRITSFKARFHPSIHSHTHMEYVRLHTPPKITSPENNKWIMRRKRYLFFIEHQRAILEITSTSIIQPLSIGLPKHSQLKYTHIHAYRLFCWERKKSISTTFVQYKGPVLHTHTLHTHVKSVCYVMLCLTTCRPSCRKISAWLHNIEFDTLLCELYSTFTRMHTHTHTYQTVILYTFWSYWWKNQSIDGWIQLKGKWFSFHHFLPW